MDSSKIFKACAFLAAVGLSFAVGYWLSPTKVVEKTKIVEVKVAETHRHIDRETRTIDRQDGSKETIIHERDNSVDNSTTNTTTDKSKVSFKDDSSWLISGLMGVKRNGLNFQLDNSAITLLIQRKLILGIYAGSYVTMDGDFGLGVTVRF